MVKKIGLVIALVGLSTSCSVFNKTEFASSDKQQYLGSRNGAPLMVRPPLTSANISDFYNLPAQNQNARISITPPK